MLDKWRLSQGWQPLSETDHDLTIAAWFEVLSDNGVPVEHYGDCYKSAMRRRVELKAEGRDVMPLSADDLVVEWRSLKDRIEPREVNGRKLLAENNAGTCQRCFGTGREQMPDGSVKEDCSHAPFSEGEVAERAEAKAKMIQFVREAAAKITPKPIETPKPKEPITAKIRMQCSACGRKVTSLEGWRFGETCGALIGDDRCQGQMRVSDEAISARI